MPFRQDQIDACFAQAKDDPKKKKGCKKMVKHKKGCSESLESKLNQIMFNEHPAPKPKKKSESYLSRISNHLI